MAFFIDDCWKVRVDANDDVEVWVGGTSKIVNSNGLDVAAGNVALAGEKAIFDNVKVGYDTGSDDVIDDYVVNETFGGTDITPTYDDNGNLTFDGNFKYTYDAWNRLVKATLDDTDVTIHEAAFDGLGRRGGVDQTNQQRASFCITTVSGTSAQSTLVTVVGHSTNPRLKIPT